MNASRRLPGFSLIEMIVVISVLATLFGITGIGHSTASCSSACQSASLNADGAAVAIESRCCAEYRNPTCDDTIMAPPLATQRHWPPRQP